MSLQDFLRIKIARCTHAIVVDSGQSQAEAILPITKDMKAQLIAVWTEEYKEYYAKLRGSSTMQAYDEVRACVAKAAAGGK